MEDKNTSKDIPSISIEMEDIKEEVEGEGEPADGKQVPDGGKEVADEAKSSRHDPNLNADIEKIFEPLERFDLEMFRSMSSPEVSAQASFQFGDSLEPEMAQRGQFGEQDYTSHRRMSQQYHHTLSPLLRKASSKSLGSQSSKLLQPGTGLSNSSSKKSIASQKEGMKAIAVIEEVPSEETDGETDRPIPKFTIGGPDEDDDVKPDTDEERSQHHKVHSHHHHHRRQDDSLRVCIGSQVNLKGMDTTEMIPTEMDEAIMLNKADLEDMATHRFEDISRKRRHKVQRRRRSSIIHGSSYSKSSIKSMKDKYKKYDHRPHEVFVELDELHKGEDNEMQWKEKARWIKFEEDVEEGGDRWGKPHVASLSFHSLLELRKGLEKGSLMLDMEETKQSDIFHRIVESMITADQIKPENSGDVMRALLLKHKHIARRQSIMKNLSSVSLASLMPMDRQYHSEANFRHMNERRGILKNISSSSLTHGDMKKIQTEPNDLVTEANSHVDEAKTPMLKTLSISMENLNEIPEEGQTAGQSSNKHAVHFKLGKKRVEKDKTEGIMRRIAKDAEATAVLVGEVDFLDQPAMAFIRLATGTVLDNFTEVPVPVRFIFVLLGPSGDMDYLEIGRSISTLMSNEHFHEIAYKADCRQDLLGAINEFIDDSIVLPPGEWDKDLLLPILRHQNRKVKKRQESRRKKEEETAIDSGEVVQQIDPLERTGILFGGLFNDIKRRYPYYLSDFRDALNVQCCAAFIFIFFACLSPAITFGGLLGEKTDNWMGVSEMIFGTAICGVVFSLFSGQPLMIIGATGPVLVFEENLYSFCKSSNIENLYLEFRGWIGIWILIITIFVIAFEGSVMVRFFTRFTEEIFALLISLIFIYEVFKKLSKIFYYHPLLPLEDYCMNYENMSATEVPYSTEMYSSNNTTLASTATPDCETNYEKRYGEPNTAFMSLILTFGTFFIAYFLRIFRNSRFLGKHGRKMLGDFGVPIGILFMCIFDYVVPYVYTEKLQVHGGFEPTDACKRTSWFVNPIAPLQDGRLGLVFVLAAAVPAGLVFILLFMEALITSLIVNKKDNKLKKGSGYHLDMFLIGLLAFVCSMLGLPWMTAATVRSVTHIGSVSTFSKTTAPGVKPKLEKIYEQRVTNLFVNSLIGLSILLGPLLSQVPLTVLFGVFLYMGVSSLSGIQLVERIECLFMPVKHHPDTMFVRQVRTWRMHMYTIIQVICLLVLWVIKVTPAALAFPFFLILLVPVRHAIGRIFTHSELEALDNDEQEMAEEEDEYWETYMPI
ncbi:band 3 anion transport protein-like isoform X2 [Anneissia japonica]|uniref:band 3 anion transport protein-like isoform X2 n=1 Tax=Anneissia japonica TaxID=1529436 RepID=UPI0014257E86|nr:band 3 anion transport protein-like isoform X2 [Anneissia japonica]